MNEAQMKAVNVSGVYKEQSYPCPFILSPSGRRNKEVLQKAKKGDKIDFITDGKISGSIIVDSTFTINKQERINKIIGGDFASKSIQNIESRIGEICVSGKYVLIDNCIAKHKERLSQRIATLNAKQIVGIVMSASPLHRIHEKIMRDALEECDLLVIFLLKPQGVFCGSLCGK